MFKRILLPIIIVFALMACQSKATAVSQSTSAPPTQGVSTPVPPTSTPEPTSIPDTNTPPPPPEENSTPTPIRVDLTPAQMAAFATLSQDKGIPTDQIQLVSTEAETWDNGCLGIVLPGVMCTKGPVEGFKIVLSSAGSTYEYHTNQDGSSVLLASSPFVRIAVRKPDKSVQVVPIELLKGLNTAPLDMSFLASGGAIGESVYALSLNPPLVVAVDANGTHPLDFIKNPNYTLAVWSGSPDNPPRLAWGTQFDNTTMQTSLMMSSPDGSQLETLISDTIPEGTPLYQLVAQRWSADGNSLYYSKEPFGIGGRILYNGASSLYRVDIETRQVTEIIPIDFQGKFICLDAFSADYLMVADHCTPGEITVRNLGTGHSVTILPPADAFDKNLIGSVRFSPDGSRVAFAGAKGDYDAEQGWLAVSNGLGSDSTLIATSDTNQYYTVLGWLDDSTILVQANTVKCDSSQCPTEIWAISADGSAKNKVTEGTFITFVDSNMP